jgi:hypothetical protein
MSVLADLLIQVLPGATAGAAITFLIRGWITERLKQSISHEYSSKLEIHKNQLEIKIQELKHTYEVDRLRTSLFFDHQRTAYAEILAKISETNQEWARIGYEDDVGLIEPVPNNLYRELRALYFKHQLFLDSESIMALDLALEIYQDSMPFSDGSGGPAVNRDPSGPYDNSEYLQPRIAALFQQKIGVATDRRAVRQLALLGAVRILNRYHFKDINLPVKGDLSIKDTDRASDAIMRAERNLPELMEKIRAFHKYLQTETSFFHEAELTLGRYISVLESNHDAEAA